MLKLPIECLAISRLWPAVRGWCAEQWTVLGQAPALAILGDQLCAVVPQAACTASPGSRTE